MKKWFLRVGIVAVILTIVMALYVYSQMRSRGFWRLPSYETVAPEIPAFDRPAILVFSKTNSFIHKEAIPAAEQLFKQLGQDNGWSVFVTENGAVHNAEDLQRFAVVVWNNVTGDVINEVQQQALKTYIEQGGGWLGLHGAGDSSSSWDWHNDVLIGAQFIGHPVGNEGPQFQEAVVNIEARSDAIVAHLDESWRRTDEWYSFADSPRLRGKTILATLDESTYVPKYFGKDISMGDDHPIIWKQCINQGRTLYSAMGHTAESYSEPEYIELLTQATLWTMGLAEAKCP